MLDGVGDGVEEVEGDPVTVADAVGLLEALGDTEKEAFMDGDCEGLTDGVEEEVADRVGVDEVDGLNEGVADWGTRKACSRGGAPSRVRFLSAGGRVAPPHSHSRLGKAQVSCVSKLKGCGSASSLPLAAASNLSRMMAKEAEVRLPLRKTQLMLGGKHKSAHGDRKPARNVTRKAPPLEAELPTMPYSCDKR